MMFAGSCLPRNSHHTALKVYVKTEKRQKTILIKHGVYVSPCAWLLLVSSGDGFL